MIWVGLVVLSVVSAILYRLGGSSPSDQEAEFPWIPEWFRTLPKKRDAGCGLVCLAGMAIVGIGAPWWAYLISFGLMWGALSTYWDPVFGYDNHFAHGFGVGLALLPCMFFDEHVALGIRVVVISVLMGVWSLALGNATWEELGRGFVIPLTLGLAVIL